MPITGKECVSLYVRENLIQCSLPCKKPKKSLSRWKKLKMVLMRGESYSVNP